MITFTVRGIPAPQGSKRAFRNKHTGRIHQVESSARVAPWRSDVRDAALSAMGYRVDGDPIADPLAGPVTIRLTFRMPRPKGHFGSGRNAGAVRLTAPAHPAGKPDVDKLARAVLDAITGIVIADDALVVQLDARKEYASLFQPGCEIRVESLAATCADENSLGTGGLTHGHRGPNSASR